ERDADLVALAPRDHRLGHDGLRQRAAFAAQLHALSLDPILGHALEGHAALADVARRHAARPAITGDRQRGGDRERGAGVLADAIGQDGVDLHGVRLTLHGDVAQLLRDELVAHQRVRGLADDDVRLVVLGERLQARAEVDGVADGRVFETLPGAERADHRLAGIDPDTVADLDTEPLFP